MWDGFDTTADALEDWHYARLDADLEQAELEQAGRDHRQAIREGNCPHLSGFHFRAEAFYPEQVGLTQGQMFCTDCNQVAQNLDGPDCMVCDLDRYNCMAERGCAPDSGKYAHDHYVQPPMILVSVAPEGGF